MPVFLCGEVSVPWQADALPLLVDLVAPEARGRPGIFTLPVFHVEAKAWNRKNRRGEARARTC